MNGNRSRHPPATAETITDNYRSIFESAAEAILIWSESGRILEANPALCACHAYAREELLGQPILKLFSPREAQQFTDRIRTMQAQGHLIHESVQVRKDGTSLPMEISTSRIIWDGQPAFVSYCRPLPDHAKEHVLLRESEARLRAITDSTKDAILMMDDRGMVSFWNPAAEQIFGYTASEVIGRHLHALLAPPRYQAAHRAAFRHFQETGEGNAIDSTLELEACHKDGHEISIELSLSKLNVLDGWHTIGIIRDVTARKKAELELRESEERFRALHDASFGGIAIHDQGRIIDCNQGLSSLTGYESTELIGMDGLLLIAPAWRTYVLEQIRSGYQEAYEAEGIRKDGSIYPISLRGSNIPFKGRKVRVTEFRDITERRRAEEERKQLEAQLTQAQKMEAIGTLAGGIAHDFNNILSAILGYVELSRSVTPPNSPASRFLDKTLQGVQRAISLVGQILSFSRRTDSGRVPLQVDPIIKEALKLLRPLLPSTILIKSQIEENCWPILADPTQVHQILMNLCTNAFHAMEETGGTLTITLTNVELSSGDLQQQPECRPGRFVQLTVGDTGPGISEEVRARIFEPYFTTKNVGKGSGMGLAIVHGIVKNYRGFLTVKSNPGAGSTFDLFLPAIEEEGAPRDLEEQPIQVGSERILLVDDEEIVADMSRSLLEHLGYRVTVFTNSLEAFNAFLEDPLRFDIVLTDQTMPLLTGFELAQRLLKIRPELPIIVCTGYSSIVSREQALAIGIRGFAMKPLSMQEVSALLRSVLDQAKPPSGRSPKT